MSTCYLSGMKRIKIWWNFFFRQHRLKTIIGLSILALCYWFCLPDPLFKDPTCMVLEARDGSLLGAKIAADGQWRFPQVEAVPEKFAKALLVFEDKRFYRHPGVDLLALARATSQNIRQGRVVSGGSTISMQVIRMARKGKSRNIFQKLIEMVLATRLEIRHSKKEILALYASHAPFGGNVVGLDAASWRYFGKKAETMSWSEAAALAVLPNSPALIHPGRNRQALMDKRNRVLELLRKEEIIDQIAFELALQEPLPDKPHALPRLAPHLLDRAFSENFSPEKAEKTSIRTTLDPVLQSQILSVAQRKSQIFKANGINNLAILVLEVETGNVLAYIGNAPQAGQENGEEVDVITSPRSTGSILKPLLYVSMLNEGQTLPNSLWADIPMHFNGYRPENSMRTFDGLVTARKSVIRSLNVPFVRMLQQYGVEKFHFQLKKLGFTTLNKPPSHYGLALILGGAEGSLWEITNSYACLSRILTHFYPNNGRYLPDDIRPANYLLNQKSSETGNKNLLSKPPVLGADAIWLALDAMREVERPTSEGDWERFESSHLIAWKTGTSFGFRDGWAIGVTSKYAVGVWVG
ncbi:MAG: penicillin-binding protein 1C, partial [Bacteroidota bacterium]